MPEKKMPTPIFTTNKRIIAEQPERLNLTRFLKGIHAKNTTFAWTAGFTQPPGVTLDTTDNITLIVGPSVSDGYQEIPLKLTATHAGDSTDTTLTLVLLTPIATLKQVATSATTYIQRLYIAGVEIERARILAPISFTNSIDATFLNQFTISAATLTLNNADGIFDFLSPRNFFANHGLPHSGKNAPVRITMGYDTAELGEITRTLFCGRIHDIVYNPDTTVTLTVFNLITDIVDRTLQVNPLSIDITISPTQTNYPLAGNAAYAGFTFLPNTARGTWTDSTGTAHRLRLVNAFDENSTGFDATQTAESLNFASTRPTGSTFTATVDIDTPTFASIGELENLLTEADVPNQRIAARPETGLAFNPITFAEDAAFNQQVTRFGKPSSIAMGADGETVYALTNTTSGGTEAPRFFKVHLPTKRFTLLHEFGTHDFVGNLTRKNTTDTLFFCLKSRRNIPSTRTNARNYPVRVVRLVIDAQENVTATDNPYPRLTAGNQYRQLQFYPLQGAAIPNQPSGLSDITSVNILSVLGVGYNPQTSEQSLTLRRVRASDGATVAGESSRPLTAIGAAWVTGVRQFWFHQTDYRLRDSRGNLYSDRRGESAGIRMIDLYGGVSMHTNANLRSLVNEPRGVLYAFSPYRAVLPLNAAGQPITSPYMPRYYFLCGSATRPKRLYVRRQNLGRPPVDVSRRSWRGYNCVQVRAYTAQNTLTYMWQDLARNRIYCIETHGTGTGATSHIYRIDDDGTTTTFVPIDSFPALGDATWITQLAVAAPVMYQNQPLFYCGWTGTGADIGFGKSFITRTTDVITQVDKNVTLIQHLNTAAVLRFAYWYFDVERLVFRNKAAIGQHTFLDYDATARVIRYRSLAGAGQPPPAGQVFIGGQVFRYRSRGAVTVNSVTYPTLAGVTAEPDAVGAGVLVAGMDCVFIADVLADAGSALVLTSSLQTETLQRIERLVLKPIDGDARLPVQVTPGETTTSIDVAIGQYSNATLTALEETYRLHFQHAALSIQVTLRPAFHLRVGDVVLLRLTEHQHITTLATIVSITYTVPAMTVQLKTLQTDVQWLYPRGYTYPLGVAYHGDRLYHGSVNQVRAQAVSNTTGALLAGFEDTLATGSALVPNTFNAGVDSTNGYLYLAWAQYSTRYIARMNIAGPGEATVLTQKWRRVSGDWNVRALAVDGTGGLWTKDGSNLVKLTDTTTLLSPGTERLAIPSSVIGHSFTWYGGYFWGVSSDALIGFRAAAGGQVESVTYTVPSRLIHPPHAPVNALSRGGLARGRLGWYFVENGDIHFYPDAVSGFNPADFEQAG